MDSLDNVLKFNLGWLVKGETGYDYKILAISDSRDELREFRLAILKKIEETG